ncbi:hypothetical protein JHL17_04975 [Azospirillum sp. YIM B02556]|uniref:DUF6455 domain-containing protein n=1 Tax=Azospirillum endophyticum TaxID=2800326 RepID=A0ABS1F015_9PROT|nr:DUF6455 family protein [Azospirillum endophyticum]MBK1836759.1 hypothetical protein [Azospirillum endophyticum]
MPTSLSITPKGRYAALLDRWRTGREMRVLASLEPLDRKAVLQEAGLAESDLAAVSRGTHARILLPAALALHGIDAPALEADHGDVMRDLLRVCMQCRKARDCARLLAGGAGGEHEQLCPNRSTIASLR